MLAKTYKEPNYTATVDPSVYKADIDNAVASNGLTAGNFSPHEAAIPNMTVVVDAGILWTGSLFVSKSQQTSAVIVAPVSDPRIDRIVYDNVTGTIEIVAGTEAASPTAPAIPSGKTPVCQVLLDNSPVTTSIVNSLITHEYAIPTLYVIDEDNMSSDSEKVPPSQQSVKAYVDSEVAAFKSKVLFDNPISVVSYSSNGAKSVATVDITAHTGSNVATSAILTCQSIINIDNIAGGWAGYEVRFAKDGVTLTNNHRKSMCVGRYYTVIGGANFDPAEDCNTFEVPLSVEKFDYDRTVSGLGTILSSSLNVYLDGYWY